MIASLPLLTDKEKKWRTEEEDGREGESRGEVLGVLKLANTSCLTGGCLCFMAVERR